MSLAEEALNGAGKNEDILKLEDITNETLDIALPKIVKIFEKATNGQVGIITIQYEKYSYFRFC